MTMLVGTNIFGGRAYHDPIIYRDVARQANGYVCGAGGAKPSPTFRPDLYPEFVDSTTCQPQAIVVSKSPLPAGPYEVRADGRGEVWLQFDGAPGGWKKFKLDGADAPQSVTFGGPLAMGRAAISRIVASNPDDPIRNLRLELPGEGKFRPEFLDDLAGFKVHRHLDTRSINDDPTVSWEDMRAAEVPKASNGTAKKVPFEDLCELANAAGADIWVCIPYHADDAYIESMARLIDDRLAPGRVVYVELSNEMWNSGFEQFKAAEAEWKAVDPKGSKQAYIGRKSGAAVNRFKVAMPSSRRCVRVASGQAGCLSNSRLAVLAAMESGGVDAIACAPYFGIFGSGDVPALAALGKRWSAGDATALDELFERIPATVETALGWTQAWRGLADQMGVPLLLYECGQHLSRRDDAALSDLYIAANRDARMGSLYTTYLDGLRDAGASLACLYASHGAPSKYGSWGLRVWVGQPDDQAPKAAKVRRWMVDNPPPVEPEPVPGPDEDPEEPEPVDPAPEPDPVEPEPVDPGPERPGSPRDGYAPNRVYVVTPETPSVVFVQEPTESDGSAGVALYYEHESRAWSAGFDPALYVRRLSPSPDAPREWSYAVPMEVIAAGAGSRVIALDGLVLERLGPAHLASLCGAGAD